MLKILCPPDPPSKPTVQWNTGNTQTMNGQLLLLLFAGFSQLNNVHEAFLVHCPRGLFVLVNLDWIGLH